MLRLFLSKVSKFNINLTLGGDLLPTFDIRKLTFYKIKHYERTRKTNKVVNNSLNTYGNNSILTILIFTLNHFPKIRQIVVLKVGKKFE